MAERRGGGFPLLELPEALWTRVVAAAVEALDDRRALRATCRALRAAVPIKRLNIDAGNAQELAATLPARFPAVRAADLSLAALHALGDDARAAALSAALAAAGLEKLMLGDVLFEKLFDEVEPGRRRPLAAALVVRAAALVGGLTSLTSLGMHGGLGDLFKHSVRVLR